MESKAIDGHNLKQIRESIKWSKNENLPKLIIAKTIKLKCFIYGKFFRMAW